MSNHNIAERLSHTAELVRTKTDLYGNLAEDDEIVPTKCYAYQQNNTTVQGVNRTDALEWNVLLPPETDVRNEAFLQNIVDSFGELILSKARVRSFQKYRRSGEKIEFIHAMLEPN